MPRDGKRGVEAVRVYDSKKARWASGQDRIDVLAPGDRDEDQER